MPDYYFEAKVSGFLLGCEKKPTEEEVRHCICKDAGIHSIEVKVIKED